ncbi:hypothetical protein OSB04_015971 [Centaurea solstitialis]|uniref:Beta-glucosidase 18-like n=1 Tax=Centaurea solstitialis TaxID=347529 RepID=A0AA38TDB4_9ASTR|nr:hypothetical protein OSB04_015971 [Centaurea solstitialis]
MEDYVHMVELCFTSFGDRVKYWITINEPNIVTLYAYEMGLFPSSCCSEPFGNCISGNSDLEPLVGMHNMIPAHGMAAKLYGDKFQRKQGGLIGITVHSFMFEPLTDSELDHDAAKRAFAFNFSNLPHPLIFAPPILVGQDNALFVTLSPISRSLTKNGNKRERERAIYIYIMYDLPFNFLSSNRPLDPIIFGDYPKEMRKYLGSELPSFSLDERIFINFIGINHYSTVYAKDCTSSSCSATADRAIQGFVELVGERDGVLIGEPTMVDGLYVVPRGMEGIVNHIKIRYNNKPMFITENGYNSPDVQEERINKLVNDVKRVGYHTSYLAFLAKSIRGGADVRGYFVWSLMDNYEWLYGYKVRFGLYHVDRKSLTRIPKLSAKLYMDFLTNKSDLTGKEASRDKRSFQKDVMMPYS